MLLQFSFANFRSFKDRVTLSLMASNLKESAINDAAAMFFAGDSVGRVLHSAAIFGANASGKSNVIKALDSFRWMVVNSTKDLQSGEKLPMESFRLSPETADEPSSFEIVACNEENIYRYGFEADATRVHREWLFQRANRKRAKDVELLYRDGSDFSIHSRMPVAEEIVSKKMVRENALTLSTAAQFNDPIATIVTKMIGDIAVVKSTDDRKMWAQAVRSIDDDDMRRRIVSFSKYADLGIDDIEKVNDTIISRHAQYAGDGTKRNVPFVMEENESEGTLKYFRLAYPLLHALDTGSTLVIDELDSQLHPILTANIIEMFNSAKFNRNNAQLIFAVHDANVLNSGLLRRDQVWFTQKRRSGESELYSLAEYNVRSSANFERDYMAGKYGAIPVMGNLNNVISLNEP